MFSRALLPTYPSPRGHFPSCDLSAVSRVSPHHQSQSDEPQEDVQKPQETRRSQFTQAQGTQCHLTGNSRCATAEKLTPRKWANPSGQSSAPTIFLPEALVAGSGPAWLSVFLATLLWPWSPGPTRGRGKRPSLNCPLSQRRPSSSGGLCHGRAKPRGFFLSFSSWKAWLLTACKHVTG